MNKIFKCIKCDLYTLNDICKRCKSKTISPKAAKFRIDDKYGEYRRKYKNGMGY